MTGRLHYRDEIHGLKLSNDYLSLEEVAFSNVTQGDDSAILVGQFMMIVLGIKGGIS